MNRKIVDFVLTLVFVCGKMSIVAESVDDLLWYGEVSKWS